MKKYDLVRIVPTQRQIAHQQTEFYAFVHFTVNTFTDKEWGDGTEREEIFNPVNIDVDQWVDDVKVGGMKGIILTCKHHDGFCLWPSKYTNHTIANSPYMNGRGDLVKEVSDACRKGNIKFGIYLSPWDRNQSLYGSGEKYDDYFVNQLTELLTGYGEIFSVWFDGACGEGPTGRKQLYNWDRYYEVIRRLQPGACISVCGPDIRWCGNEAGHTRKSEWSVVPKRTQDTEKISDNSQKEDNESFRERSISAQDEDLGSRKIMENEKEAVWYPAEVNTSIRPGWFYHKSEDDKVKSLESLKEIYINSVGGNATFLLNIPPAQDGLFHKNDVERLTELGEWIRNTFSDNMINDASLYASSEDSGHRISSACKDDYDTFYKAEDGCESVDIDISWSHIITAKYLVLKENINLSQRIESFEILNDEGQTIYKGTTVGYKKIAKLGNITTKHLTIRITSSRVCPTLSFLAVY